MKKLLLPFLFMIQFIVVAQNQQLLLHYPFNKSFNDVSQNLYHGTAVNGAQLMSDTLDCIHSGYVNFDGIDDYVNATTLSALTSQLDTFTIGFYIKADSNVTDWSTLFKSVNTASTGMVLGIDIHRNQSVFKKGQINFHLRDDNGNKFDIEVYVPNAFDNQWHSLVFVVNSSASNNIDVYLDHNLVSKTVYFSTSPATFSSFQYPFALGAANNRGTINKFFKGSIDDFRIFGRALTQSEISKIYSTSDLILDLPFNGNSNDQTIYLNNGTAVNGPALVADRFLLINSAYSFDGVNDYILLNNLPQLPGILDAFSIVFWMKADSNVSSTSTIFKSVNTPTSGLVIGVDAHKQGGSGILVKGTTNVHIRDINGNYFDYNFNTKHAYDDNWHCIAILIKNSPSNLIDMYVDGVITTKTANTSTGPVTFQDFEFPFTIGAGNNRGTIGSFFKGTIDDFKIYKCVISQTVLNQVCSQSYLNVNEYHSFSSEFPFKIYPNPFLSDLKIENISGQVGELVIYNSIGEVVYSEFLNKNTGIVNTSNWSTGLYLVVFKEKETGTMRTVKITKN